MRTMKLLETQRHAGWFDQSSGHSQMLIVTGSLMQESVRGYDFYFGVMIALTYLGNPDCFSRDFVAKRFPPETVEVTEQVLVFLERIKQCDSVAEAYDLIKGSSRQVQKFATIWFTGWLITSEPGIDLFLKVIDTPAGRFSHHQTAQLLDELYSLFDHLGECDITGIYEGPWRQMIARLRS